MAYTFKHGDRPLEGFTIQRGVGHGGFGEVYYALSDGGKEVALKYLRDNPTIELRGVSHCLNLKDPHLVSIYDVRQNDRGEHFIVLEYVAGPSLRDLLLAEPHGLGVQKAAYFLREIGKGLSHLHNRGIVHRDLKPGNIFFEDGRVKIGDYGLAKFISTSRHSVQTASVGTVHYMAPEIATGSYSQSVDVYALGVILYEMLLGRVPFDGATMGEVLMKHLASQPEVEALPAPFPDVIRKALAKDPKDRFASVDEMVEAVFGEPAIATSVAGFDAVSLRELAAEVERKGVRVGAAHEVSPPATAPPVLTADRETPPSMTFVLVFATVIVSCLLILKDHTFLGIAVLVAGWSSIYSVKGIYERKGRGPRSRRSAGDSSVAPGSEIGFPISRSFVIARRADLADVLKRYFVSLGYAPGEAADYKDSLLWVFTYGEWSEDEFSVRVAAYEVPEGYHVTCAATVEDPDEVRPDTRLQIVREIGGLEHLFRSLDDSGAGSTRSVGDPRQEILAGNERTG